jgi:hypothetical protein
MCYFSVHNYRTMLHSADILVLLKLMAAGRAPALSVRKLEQELGLPKSSVANSLRRLNQAHLLMGDRRERRLSKLALLELLTHSIRYLFPSEIGGWVLGLPTAYSIKELAEELMPEGDPIVMPLAEGPQRGRSLEPIHPLAPIAAARDPRLHLLLALVDALRIGQARERKLAAQRLKQCLDEETLK